MVRDHQRALDLLRPAAAPLRHTLQCVARHRLQPLQAHFQLANTLARMDKTDEARSIVDEVYPVALRVLGPDHFLTRSVATAL